MALTEHDKTRAAAEQVDAQIGFYIHLTVFVLVNILLVALNYYNQDDGWWAQWAILGWGIGIIGHAFAVFGRTPQVLRDWRLRRIQRLRSGL
jgi:hypothetical protein